MDQDETRLFTSDQAGMLVKQNWIGKKTVILVEHR